MSGLTGIPADYATPGIRREFFFASGPGSSGTSRDVLIYGNKTSAGSEPLDTLGAVLGDKADVWARFGKRSEFYHLWRLFTAVDKTAPIYGIAVTESAGSAASVVVSFGSATTDTASATTTCTIEFQGESAQFTVAAGATASTVAGLFVTAFNNASEGTWMATAQQQTSTNAYKVTITGSQLGPRLDGLFNYSLRVTYKDSVGVDPSIGSVTAGVTDDDFTAAYAAASAGEFFYQISPKSTTSAPTATDNGVGEGIAYIKDQNLPINGKSQEMHFGLVGTQSQATTVATDSDANSVHAFFWHQENSRWTPGMIAAHMCGIERSEQVADPAANLAGYRATDNKVMLGPPDPISKADRATTAEIEANLRNGVCAIAYDKNGSPYIARHVTSYSEISSGVKDYRAREGHIPSAVKFAWDLAKSRWNAEKQPKCGDDPLPGAKPIPGYSTPSQLRGLLNGVIDELTSGRPLGLYNSPILSPSPADVQAMRDSIVVTHVPGGFNVSVNWIAVEHNLFGDFVVREVGRAY